MTLWRLTRAWCCGALALVLVPARSVAQSPADRAMLARWDDSLQAIMAAPRLAALDPISKDGPVGDVRRVLFVLRRGELTRNRQDLELVITDAAWIDKQHPRWPWNPFIAARAFAAMRTAKMIRLNADGMPNEEGQDESVWRFVRESLDIDPEFAPARHYLIPLLVAGGDRLLREDQGIALQRIVDRPTPDPDALLVWGRHLRTYRNYDSALVYFDRAITAGGDLSRLELERARTLRAVHDEDGAAKAYWNGLAHLTPIGREMYHHDLAWIISTDSLAAFDKLPDHAVLPWMRRFWNERDAAAANLPGDRLIEHLRRWVVAYARYRVLSPWRRTQYDRIEMFFDNSDCVHVDLALYRQVWSIPPTHAGDLRDKEWLLDHRGLVYLRHGEPAEILGTLRRQPAMEDFLTGRQPDQVDSTDRWTPWAKGGGGAKLKGSGTGSPTAGIPAQNPPHRTESWLMSIDGEQRLLNFRDSYSIGMYDATTLSSFLPVNMYTWALRTGTNPLFSAAVQRMVWERDHPQYHPDSPSCYNEVKGVIAQSRADAHTGMTTDTDEPVIAHPWPSLIQMFALGHEREGNAKALLTFAVAADTLRLAPTPDGRFGYAIHFRVVAYQLESGATVTIDTVRRFASTRVFNPGEALTAFLEVPLSAGTWQIAVRANQDGPSGAFAIRRDIHVDGANAFTLSDLVMGIATSPPWQAPDGAGFPVNALAKWPVGSTAELYYEVRGVPDGQEYHTTVEVRPTDPKNKGVVRITTTDHSTGAATLVRKSLGLERLPAGTYQVVVTVQNGDKTAVRKQALSIFQPK